MSRPSRISTLFAHEFARFRRNPPALMLLGVLTLVALLMATGTLERGAAARPAAAPQTWVVVWAEGDFADHLEREAARNPRIAYHRGEHMFRSGESILYPPNTPVIEVSPDGAQIWLRPPEGQLGAIVEGQKWFWEVAWTFHAGLPPINAELKFLEQAVPISPELALDDVLSVQTIGMLLLFSVQFFAACALLVSHTSQEKERGTLHALALSPAKPRELLIAKLAFHLLLTLVFCALIAALLRPAALANPGFWVVLSLTAIGFMSVGVLVTSLAGSQSTASMFSFLYVMGIGTVTFLSTQFSAFAWVRSLTFEAYAMGLMHQALDERVARLGPVAAAQSLSNSALSMLALLSVAWLALASWVFTRRGWR